MSVTVTAADERRPDTGLNDSRARTRNLRSLRKARLAFAVSDTLTV